MLVSPGWCSQPIKLFIIPESCPEDFLCRAESDSIHLPKQKPAGAATHNQVFTLFTPSLSEVVLFFLSLKLIHTSEVWIMRRRSKLWTWGCEESDIYAASGKKTWPPGTTQKQNAPDIFSPWRGQRTMESGAQFQIFPLRLISGVLLQ